MEDNSHLKCPRYKNCPWYNEKLAICNKTSGMYLNKAAACWIAYDRFKAREIKKNA